MFNDFIKKGSGRPQKETVLCKVAVNSISVNPYQPRRQFDQSALEELAASIRAVGLIQPPVVRSLGGALYELVSGERRFRAAQLAQMEELPVLVADCRTAETAEAALIENIQRVDLNPLEIAHSLDRLMDDFRLSQEELSLRIGKKRSTVANYLRLLSLPEEIKAALREGRLSMGHAKALLSITCPNSQKLLADRIGREGLSVRQAESKVKTLVGKEEKGRTGTPKDVHLAALQNALQEKFGTKIIVQGSESKGKISIDYYNLDDLDRLIDLLGIRDAVQ